MSTPAVLLHGARLRLEPLQAAHADALYPVLSDPELYRHLDHGPPADLERLRHVFGRMQAGRSPDGREQWLNWVLCTHDGGEALGTVQATVRDDGCAWVAWMLARHVWGRGYAAEAVGLMLAHLRRHGQVRQAQACVEAANDRSEALARRLGFRAAKPAELAPHTLTRTERLWLLDLSPGAGA
ncbi:MAG: GNAT family N-acetyltransferase [Rubrivivax sp.]